MSSLDPTAAILGCIFTDFVDAKTREEIEKQAAACKIPAKLDLGRTYVGIHVGYYGRKVCMDLKLGHFIEQAIQKYFPHVTEFVLPFEQRTKTYFLQSDYTKKSCVLRYPLDASVFPMTRELETERSPIWHEQWADASKEKPIYSVILNLDPQGTLPFLEIRRTTVPPKKEKADTYRHHYYPDPNSECLLNVTTPRKTVPHILAKIQSVFATYKTVVPGDV